MPQTADALANRKNALKAVLDEPKPLSCRERLMKAGKTAAEADAQCTEHEYNTDKMKKADSSIFRSK